LGGYKLQNMEARMNQEQIIKEAIGNLFDLLISYKMPNGTTDKELAEFMETTIDQAVQDERDRIIEKVIEMSVENKHPLEDREHYTTRVSGYNQARFGIIKSLKEKNE